MKSILLRTTARISLPLILIFSLHILFRGHHLPGGGFIAGLLTAIAFGLLYLSFDIKDTDKLLPIHPYWLIFSGLLIAVLTSTASFLFGKPFLTSNIWHVHLGFLGEVEIASALFFDLGVYLTVVGVTTSIFQSVGEYNNKK